MKDLTTLLKNIGCTDVWTYIQSGNVVLNINRKDRRKFAEEISQNIFDQFGFLPEVMLLESSELQKAIDNNPYDTGNGKALHFNFLASPPPRPDLDTLTQIKSATEQFKLIDNIFYLYAPDGIGRSKLASKVEQCLGVPITGRNWNTINKLASMINEK